MILFCHIPWSFHCWSFLDKLFSFRISLVKFNMISHVYELDLFCFILLRVQDLGHVVVIRSSPFEVVFLPFSDEVILGAFVVATLLFGDDQWNGPSIFASLGQWPSWLILFRILLGPFTWLLWLTVQKSVILQFI